MRQLAGRSQRLLRFTAPLLAFLLLCGGCTLLRRRNADRPPYRKLSPPVAYEMMRDNPEMLVLDLRPAGEFLGETGHLRQARNIPLERLPYRLLEISPFREDTFLVYCGTGDCGVKGMDILLASGFENAVLMEGGIDKWIQNGFRTVLPKDALGRKSEDGKGLVMPLRPGEKRPEPAPDPTPPPPRLQSSNTRGGNVRRPELPTLQGELS